MSALVRFFSNPCLDHWIHPEASPFSSSVSKSVRMLAKEESRVTYPVIMLVLRAVLPTQITQPSFLDPLLLQTGFLFHEVPLHWRSQMVGCLLLTSHPWAERTGCLCCSCSYKPACLKHAAEQRRVPGRGCLSGLQCCQMVRKPCLQQSL